MDITGIWRKARRLPCGELLFRCFIASRIPYSGSIGARFLRLEPGDVVLSMPDRRALRNHLGSIHAAALMNFAELTTGLALNTALAPDHRAILVGYSMEFLKKARGTLTAAAQCGGNPPPGEIPVEAEIRDEANDVVARATARWKVGLK